MSSISFSGVASGLDTAKIIEQLVAIKRRPIVRFETNRSDLKRSLAALDDLKAALQNLATAAKALDTEAEFTSRAARSGDSDLFTATASSATPVGSFNITVDKLAQTHRLIGQSYSSPDDDIGTGDFSITLGADTTTLTLQAGASSLADLKIAINDSDAGVTASIVNDGSGFRLMLSSDESGLANQFTVDSTGLSGGTDLTLAISTTGDDAQITIDQSIVVTSSTNTINGALEGTTIELKATGTTELVVEGDTEDLAKKLTEFVDAYNEIRTLIDAQSGPEGTLRSSPLLRSVRDNLSRVMTTSLSTGDLAHERIVAANIGLKLDRDGVMSLDESKLSDAIDQNYGDVLDLFTRGITDTSRGGIALEMVAALNAFTGTADGLISLRKNSIDGELGRIDDRILRQERSLELYEQTLTRKFTAMELAISRLQAQSGSLFGF